MKVLAERKKFFPRVLRILEEEVSVVWLFFFDKDSCGFGFGSGGWSRDHDEVRLWPREV